MKSMFLILVLLLAASACSSEKQPFPRPDNILLIVVDTLRADHLGCYGYERPTTPHVDRLATEGLAFDQYYTVVPTTLASFTSLLTSRHPRDHGAYRNGFQGDQSLPLLSEAFCGAGYETAAFIASFCLSAEFGINRGFDHFNEEYSRNTILPDNELIRPGNEVTDSFFRWAEIRESDRPFFALLHYFDPHWPYTPPDPYLKSFGARRRKTQGPFRPSFIEAQEALKASGGKPGPFEKNQHNLYCAEIQHTDAQIGRVLDYLEESGLREDTLVVFTSDHGESFWDNEHYFSHGIGVFESTTRIPLIISWPGFIEGPRRSARLLCNLDLAPTLCRFSGIEPPAEFQGIDFSGHLVGIPGGDTAERAIFAEATKPIDEEKDSAWPNQRKAKSIRVGPWKLIHYPYAPEKDAFFNIAEDPQEQCNLREDPQHADRIKALATRLEKWASRFNVKKPAQPGLDAEAQRKLGELGY